MNAGRSGTSPGSRAISAEAPGAATIPAPSGTAQNRRAAVSSRAVAALSGSARLSILSVLVLFVAGGWLLTRVDAREAPGAAD